MGRATSKKALNLAGKRLLQLFIMHPNLKEQKGTRRELWLERTLGLRKEMFQDFERQSCAISKLTPFLME